MLREIRQRKAGNIALHLYVESNEQTELACKTEQTHREQADSSGVGVWFRAVEASSRKEKELMDRTIGW